jgi:N-acetylglutamate synthase-like GNAT family acetyltransferase
MLSKVLVYHSQEEIPLQQVTGSIDSFFEYIISMIRQFRDTDAIACSKLICDCLQNDKSLSLFLRKKMLEQETPETMRMRAKLFYNAVYESENRILGIAGLDMNEIRLLYVSPESQRRGIGRMLLDHIRPMVPGALFPDIFVYSSLQAADFYKAYGFTEKGPYPFNFCGIHIPTVFLTLTLP